MTELANAGMLAAYGIDGCGCQACVPAVVSQRPWPDNLMYPFIVCATCGNKRCPKATLHTNDCTGSNAYGQAGSSYGGLTIDLDSHPTDHPTEGTL